MQTFSYPSKSSSAVYTAAISDSGRLECDCKGWIVRREGKPRHCTHTKDIVSSKGLSVVERDGYVFVSGAATVEPPKPKPASFVPTRFVNPMLASPLPDGKSLASFGANWALEEKFDGHRVVVAVSAGQVIEAWSRPQAGSNGRGLSRELPEQILADFANFPIGTYDGELIMPGGKSPDVAKLANAPKLKFVVFDVPKLLGQDLIGKPFSERRTYLEVIFEKTSPTSVFLSPLLPVSKATVDAIWARGGEGAILKRMASTYRPGARTDDWLKVKSLFSEVLTCIGFEEGRNGPNAKVKLVDAKGHETTVKVRNVAELRAIDKNPASFIGRKLAIEFTERMPSGAPRHGRFDHWL